MSSQNLKIAHVSSAHPWTDNRIHYRECASLVEGGYDVTLVAVESAVSAPRDSVRVITIPALSRTKRMVLSPVRAVGLALRTRAKVLHLHDPELILLIPALRLMGKIVIYDAHEDLPSQVSNKAYLSRLQRPLVSFLARALVMIAGMSSHVIAATEVIALRFPRKKTSVVRNFPPLRDAERSATEVTGRDKTMVYVGGIEAKRGSNTMIAATESDAFPEGWSLALAGAMGEEVKAKMSAMKGWANAKYFGELKPEDARELILRARVGLVVLDDNPAYRDSLPTKMFEYFAAGVPVVASDFPLWRSIVDDYQCGQLVDPYSAEEVALAVRLYAENEDLLREHSKNARRLAVERYNWTSEAQVLLGVYTSLEAGGKGIGHRA